jgi:hypothetical protein
VLDNKQRITALLEVWRLANTTFIMLSFNKQEFFQITEQKSKYWGKLDGTTILSGMPNWKLHRLNGPAEIHINSKNYFYWVDGVWCQDKKEYDNKLQKFLNRSKVYKGC